MTLFQCWREVLGDAWMVLWDEVRAWLNILSAGALFEDWAKRRYR